MINGFVNSNSFINRLNPTIKIVIFTILIIATFLPFGFSWQIITLAIIHVFWIAGKVSFRTYWKSLVSLAIMFTFLLIINWISYKDPGTSFILDANGEIISPKWWWANNSSASPGTYYEDNNRIFLAGQIFGGNGVGGVGGLGGTLFPNLINLGNSGFYSTIKLEPNQLQELINQIEITDPGRISVIIGPQLDGSQYIYVYASEWYSISTYGITLALFVTLKIFSTILIVNILTATTSPLELTYGFNEILHPLSYFKIPINELAMILTLSIRFIPSLLEESHRVLKAQASRGVDIKRGNFFDKTKALVSLLIPMFAISFRKSEELSNAMEARAYNPRIERSRYRNFNLKFEDWIILFLVAVFFGITLFFSISSSFGKTFMLAPMGIIDAIILVK